VLGKVSIGNPGLDPWNRTRVHQYMNGKLVARHRSATDAAEAVGTHQGQISRVCRGEKKHCRGFEWKYVY
jgi:hypothetical protein